MITKLDIPAIRTREQQNLIQTLAVLLQRDDRVKAAWISGPIARGEDDWLSDIDLYIAVADESIEDIVYSRHEFAARFMTPTLSMDQMRNATPRGGYLLVHYPGEYGPQHVDWCWQPESLANFSDNGLLLFDKVGLPVVDGKVWVKHMHQTGSRSPIDSTDSSDLATHNLQFFWAISLIFAKYIVRGDDQTVGRMMGLINERLIGSSSRWGSQSVHPESQVVRSQVRWTQFQVLRGASDRAKSLHGDLGGRGVVVPAEAIAEVERFFDACESVVVVQPSVGSEQW